MSMKILSPGEAKIALQNIREAFNIACGKRAVNRHWDAIGDALYLIATYFSQSAAEAVEAFIREGEATNFATAIFQPDFNEKLGQIIETAMEPLRAAAAIRNLDAITAKYEAMNAQSDDNTNTVELNKRGFTRRTKF